AGMSSFATLPSSTASTSMVALSVSISAMTSPAFTCWPSATSHLASLPSSMVGDSAGIRISVGISSCLFPRRLGRASAMTQHNVAHAACVGSALRLTQPTKSSSSLHQHVRDELALVRLGIGLREFRCANDDAADLGIDGLEVVLGGEPAVEKPAAYLLDRVVLLAHLLHLLAGAVLGRVRHGVPAIAVGEHLQDVGPVALAHPLDHAAADRLHRAHVHAVDLLARDVERPAALGEIRGGGRALHGGAHGILVVLDDEHDGELPQLGHVEALVDLALVRGPVAEVGEAHRAVAAVMVGKGDARSQRHVGADDAV